MNRLEAALLDISGYLEGERIPHMVIGGFANLRWGRPRLTEDLDLKVQMAEPSWSSFVDGLKVRYQLLAGEPLQFARETHVVPIATPAEVRIDLILATLPFEEEAIQRAIEIPLGRQTVRICTAEDLILHKIISHRVRDRDDVEGVIARQVASLDRTYLDPRIEQLAAGLENPEIVDFYRTCLRRAGRDDLT